MSLASPLKPSLTEQARNGVVQESGGGSVSVGVGVSGDKPNGSTEDNGPGTEEAKEAVAPSACSTHIPQVMKIKWTNEETDKYLQNINIDSKESSSDEKVKT